MLPAEIPINEKQQMILFKHGSINKAHMEDTEFHSFSEITVKEKDHFVGIKWLITI